MQNFYSIFLCIIGLSCICLESGQKKRRLPSVEETQTHYKVLQKKFEEIDAYQLLEIESPVKKRKFFHKPLSKNPIVTHSIISQEPHFNITDHSLPTTSTDVAYIPKIKYPAPRSLRLSQLSIPPVQQYYGCPSPRNRALLPVKQQKWVLDQKEHQSKVFNKYTHEWMLHRLRLKSMNTASLLKSDS